MLKPLVLLVLALCGLHLQAQEVKPRGYFSKDSMKVGEVVDYTLIVDYPRGMEILFPDSSFSFSSFEYVDRSFQQTESDLTTSHDSVVYQFTTFEMDSVQRLTLPIYIITGGDSLTLAPPVDSVIMQFMITESLDSLSVKETANYQEVNKAFNYPYLLIGMGVLGVLIAVVLMVFGKRIRTRLLLYRLRLAHERFVNKFAQLQTKGLKSVEQAEFLLAYWKRYLEKLDGLPYTKLTTKEIVTIEENQEFKDTLKLMDRNIYGQFNAPSVDQLSTKLKEYSIDRYQKKIEELKHV
ncbi:MAG: hypothetical protein OER04_06465 [Cyclobacteriaceae bacterium]|nr:hypothetical protein [Cyclobacteriaceae bacterium]